MIVTSLPQRTGWPDLLNQAEHIVGLRWWRTTEQWARVTTQCLSRNGSWWSWPWDPCLHHLVIGRVKDNEVLWRSSMVCIRYLLISVWYPHPFSWLKILLLSFGKLSLFHCVKSHWDYQSEHLVTSPHVTKVRLTGFSLILWWSESRLDEAAS